MVFKRIAAVLLWLLVTLTSAFGFVSSELETASGDFFCGTLEDAGRNDSPSRFLCRINGWLNYDTLSECAVAANKVPTINGRNPINSRYAGQTHPSGVKFNDQGFPDFGPHSKAQVEIDGLSGVPRIDNRLANQAAGFGNSSKAPNGFVWHHVENGRTMQLVPVDIHSATRHTGGSAIIRNGGLD